MKRLNVLSQIIIHLFKNRSILFYIFWLSFIIGQISHQFLYKIFGCNPLPSVKDKYLYSPNSPANNPCDFIGNGLVEMCMAVWIFSIASYFIWYVFKCLRYVFRLGFKR